MRGRTAAPPPARPPQGWEKIPVVLIDGQLHGHWRVSPDRLRIALNDTVGAGEEAE